MKLRVAGAAETLNRYYPTRLFTEMVHDRSLRNGAPRNCKIEGGNQSGVEHSIVWETSETVLNGILLI
jgi:hypothetical protein